MTSVKKTVDKTNKTKPKKVVLLGSDFSGLGPLSVVTRALQSKFGLSPDTTFKTAFACDAAKACKKLIMHKNNDPPETFYDDVRDRLVQTMARVDIYQATPPCQGFSTAGPRSAEDDRNFLFKYAIDYLKAHQPKAFILENVAALALERKYKATYEHIKSEIEKAGYVVHAKLIDTKDMLAKQTAAVNCSFWAGGLGTCNSQTYKHIRIRIH
jgi:site-specific DNA-cytosine methylase